ITDVLHAARHVSGLLRGGIDNSQFAPGREEDRRALPQTRSGARAAAGAGAGCCGDMGPLFAAPELVAEAGPRAGTRSSGGRVLSSASICALRPVAPVPAPVMKRAMLWRASTRALARSTSACVSPS